MTPSPHRRAAALAALVAFATAACSNGGGGPPTASTPTILRTSPPDGATDVEPDVEVTVDVALPPGGAPDGAVTVSDGVNDLPGSFELVDGATWRWTSSVGLPRGSAIELRTPQQGTVARFTVREAATRRVYSIADFLVEQVFAWPNGRVAVYGEGRWFEVTDAGVVERFPGMPASIVPYGDGLAAYIEYSGIADAWLVRGGLDGERDRVLMPPVAFGVDVNARGDIVTFVRENLFMPGTGGFYVLPHDGVAFDYRAPLSTFYLIEPKIDDDGAVSGTWSEPGELRFTRWDPNSPAPEQAVIPATSTSPKWDVAADGSGWLVWTVRDGERWVLLGRRFEPGTGLADAVELADWLPQPGFSAVQCAAAITSLAGSTTVEVNVTGIGPVYQQFVRVERDGWSSIPTASSTPMVTQRLLRSAVRGEAWLLRRSADRKELGFVRSRPRREAELERLFYRVPEPGFEVGDFQGAVDDAGRATVAFRVDGIGPGQRITRVVVLE